MSKKQDTSAQLLMKAMKDAIVRRQIEHWQTHERQVYGEAATRIAELERKLADAESVSRQLASDHADLFAANVGLNRRLAEALELIDELRGYAQDWDWKCGRRWDEQRRRVAGESG